MQTCEQGQKLPLFFKLVLLTLLIQTVVVSNVVKGLVVPYCLIILLFLTDILTNKNRLITICHFFLLTLSIYIVFFTLQQASNLLLFDFALTIEERRIISGESIDTLVFRNSTFTQSAYFLVCLLYFGYSLYFIRNKRYNSIVKIAEKGVIIYAIYGIFVYAGHLLLNLNLDFLSNRITGDNHRFGGYTNWIQFGEVSLPRFISLSGEASMFAFAIVPFMIFYYYLRRYALCFFLLILLILSTATTAIAGIMAFVIVDIFLYRKSFKFIALSSFVLILFLVMKLELLISMYEFFIDKLNRSSLSGIERYNSFMESMALFNEMGLINQLIGIGFGYIRATDGFSTILVNNGVLGFLAVMLAYFIPMFKVRARGNERIKALKVSNLVILFMTLTSVPEFYNLHIYLFLALLWGEYLLGSNTRRCSGTACS